MSKTLLLLCALACVALLAMLGCAVSPAGGTYTARADTLQDFVFRYNRWFDAPDGPTQWETSVDGKWTFRRVFAWKEGGLREVALYEYYFPDGWASMEYETKRYRGCFPDYVGTVHAEWHYPSLILTKEQMRTIISFDDTVSPVKLTAEQRHAYDLYGAP